MSNRNSTKTLANRKIGSKKKNGDTNRSNQLVILTEPGRFAPDRLICRLVYQDPTSYRTFTGTSNAMNWAYRSSAYDPDPAVLSGAIPGFAELANMYSFYCVHSIDAEIEIANQNTESVVAVLWPSNVIQSVNSLTLADLAEYSTNVYGEARVLSNQAGMNRALFRTSAAGKQLVGDRFKTDLDYSGSTAGNPTLMYGINIGVYDPYANFTYGVVVRARLIYQVEFFRIRQLEN